MSVPLFGIEQEAYEKAMKEFKVGIDRDLLYKKTTAPKWLKALGSFALLAGFITLWWFLLIVVIGYHAH